MGPKSARERVENVFCPFANENEFLVFAKPHLSREVPNPERIAAHLSPTCSAWLNIPFQNRTRNSANTSPAVRRASTATWKFWTT